MIHIFEDEFHEPVPRTPIDELRIATPIATELLAEAAREIDADDDILAGRAMIRIQTAVDIMRGLPREIIDASLDLTLADLSCVAMIGIYDSAYVRRLTNQMTLQIGRITSYDDDQVWLNALIDSPPPALENPAPVGYDRAAVLGAAAAIRRCVRLIEAGQTDADAMTVTLRGIGRSLMTASLDLRYSIGSETLLHMSGKNEITSPRLQLLAALLIDDADKVTADPAILGTGALQLGIRALDEILNPPPTDTGPKAVGTRAMTPKAARKRKVDDQLEDIRDELRHIKALI